MGRGFRFLKGDGKGKRKLRRRDGDGMGCALVGVNGALV